MFLGIDVGTSAVKALLMDEHSLTVAETDVPLTLSNPKPFWSEQHPDDWWAATCTAKPSWLHALQLQNTKFSQTPRTATASNTSTVCVQVWN